MPKKNYVISKSTLYEEVKNKLFTTYKPIELPVVQELTPQWHNKKIPLAMWQEILAFMKHSYDVLKSETMCFLYYDETAKQPWSFWVPPQITNGMTVKSDPDHINFQVQRAMYPDTMFGTVHHHCSSSAFQSGTDEADETNREGFHFTIGCLNKPDDIDIHFRWCLDNECHELDDLSMVIGGAQSPFKDAVELDDKLLDIAKDYMNEQLHQLPESKSDFAEYMDNVSKAVVPSYKKYSRQTQDMFGSFDYEKKTTDTTIIKDDNLIDNDFLTIEDITDEILFTLKLNWDAEELISKFYTEHESQDSVDKIQDLVQGITTDEEYGRVIRTMLTHSVYQTTKDGAYFRTTFEECLDTFKDQGYILSENDILSELEAIEQANDI